MRINRRLKSDNSPSIANDDLNFGLKISGLINFFARVANDFDFNDETGLALFAEFMFFKPSKLSLNCLAPLISLLSAKAFSANFAPMLALISASLLPAIKSAGTLKLRR